MEEISQEHDSESTAEHQPLRSSGGKSDNLKGPISLAYEGIVKKGMLAKKGRKRIFRPWALRTIILDNRNILSYYDGRTLKGSLNLEGTNVTLIPPEKADGRSFAFEVSNISNTKTIQSNNLILAAGSQAEAEEWVDAIISLTRKHFSAKSTSQYESLEVS